MKKLLITLSFAILGLAMNNTLTAQKVGYVDTQALIQDIPEVKEANSNIETYKTQLQKKGQEMVKSLQAEYQALERKQANGEISPKELEVEAAKLKEKEQALAQFEQSSQEKIMKKGETLLKPLRDRIQNAIDEVAAENGYAYIIDASIGVLLYADPSADVGAMVKAKLGL